MKRYLIIKYWLYDKEIVVTTDTLEKKHLLDLKQRMCEAIIDLQNGTYFDAENNVWKEIVEKLTTPPND